ncbi:MAG: DUF934 domain-containing protein [Methylococcaceae bacterium]|nr:DUF934 domain-containing protein [Methylococcaceae bacterium]
MQIIKDKQLVESNWTYVADGDALNEGDITVSLARWNEEKSALQAHQGKVGVRLESDADVNVLAEDVDSLTLVELNFPAFTDGRGFSHARLLRDELNYQGEIRAIGSYMPDQAFYLSRVGVNAFAMKNADELAVALSTLDDFSVKYQASTL